MRIQKCLAWGGAKIAVCLLLVVAALGSRSEAQPESPFLWRIERDPPAFLYGTIHVADSRVARLPPAVTRAQDASHVTYIELDPRADISEDLLFLPWNQRISDWLTTSDRQRLHRLLLSLEPNLNVQVIDSFKPWVVETMLAFMWEMELGLGEGEILDLILYDRALQQDRQVGELETMEEQVAAFDSIPMNVQIDSLMATVDVLENWSVEDESLVEFLIEAYLSGDEGRFLEALWEDDTEVGRIFAEAILFGRNEVMAERMMVQLERSPEWSFFFAVGVAHYIGERSVNEMLEAAGYRITRIRDHDWLWLLHPKTEGTWRKSTWLGRFAAEEGSPWLFLADRGWLWFHGRSEDSLYFHAPDGRWFWTGRHLYPHVFDFAAGSWVLAP